MSSAPPSFGSLGGPAAPGIGLPPVLPYAFARAQGVLIVPGTDRLAIRRGAKPAAVLEARRVAGRALAPETMAEEAFDRLLSEAYATDGLSAAAEAAAASNLSNLVRESADLLDNDDAAPVIRLINALVAQAVQRGASDIHLEPAPGSEAEGAAHGMAVRLRHDGVMEEVLRLPAEVAPMLVSRVKVMARLDIAEKRLPQDGRISLTLGNRALDVRVSTLPARGGERVVMRILDQSAVGLELTDLGLDAATHGALKDALSSPNGIVLVTGPTGAGKTTTLYAALKLLNDGKRNILTVEDPVEYAVPGVGQTQVDTRVGLTFAQGLRAILRQDPDVVMVGEIRDRETAEIAVQAALTGHLVLSTVHANSAAGAITRLRDFGVETFLIAATLRAVVAQRLVRLVCPVCMTEEPLAPALARRIGLPSGLPVAKANGCDRCRHSGYTGRKGLFELITADGPVRALINDGAGEGQLERAGLQRSLMESARAAVREKRTTPTEVLPLFQADVVRTPAGTERAGAEPAP
ncbi:Flp pilus assembly complex ATPase component TadA [Sandaracinobacter sp. RS1-74]|uniref:GspE/PulE family protein n=1 Tax=Sandaracinobacteroides sayramensis TaxID=2913411 RepID=UPI001EDAAE9A|nr:ATPase, T2SS/T4P/T4SS family [Sandaracinobacteroides sayramensis]MCG2842737.1 Flp pilus assembly complex ATPase component TadA [Sandaracinobacteroides sayramensis]